MPGPHPRNHGFGAGSPPRGTPDSGRADYGRSRADGAGAAAPPSAAYPGLLPPPVAYPARRRLVAGAAVAFTLISGLAAAIIYGLRQNQSTEVISDATAKTAIQGYLNALEHRDTDTIARNTLCGIYDAVQDRRPDLALARLSSDAFRKQFSDAQVTAIDKIVYWSRYQAQVLFTMRVAPAGGGQAREHLQGMAQLLAQHNQVLVCSYVLRTAGSY
ncbi:hypothetical protein [Mycobacterium sp.]|uniref:Rv0361 family membrane protein n=1 Tax=Mycobacterium sp. TaxID=1785 RepID=UPI00127E0957|nr:hypothetical protein [Mycobacterium sp.]KAA8969318.1 MAG: hypothetical protein F6Q13_03410 [Mycobacterium sp.]